MKYAAKILVTIEAASLEDARKAANAILIHWPTDPAVARFCGWDVAEVDEVEARRKTCPNCGHHEFLIVVENQDAIWMDTKGGTHYVRTVVSGRYLEDEPVRCLECGFTLDWAELEPETEEVRQ